MERFGLPGMQVCKKAMTITRRYSFDVSRVTPVVLKSARCVWRRGDGDWGGVYALRVRPS